MRKNQIALIVVVPIVLAYLLALLLAPDTQPRVHFTQLPTSSPVPTSHAGPLHTVWPKATLGPSWSTTARPTKTVTRSTTRPKSGPVNWDGIARCESGGHWNHHTATAGKYWGGLQMDMNFWRSYHGDRDFAARPDLATKAQQIVVAERAYKTRGLRPWPYCGRFG